MSESDEHRAWRRDHRIARWLLWRLLRLIESLLMFSYGWRRVGPDWKSPSEWRKPGELYNHEHAVNSTKYYLAGRNGLGRSSGVPMPGPKDNTRMRKNGRPA